MRTQFPPNRHCERSVAISSRQLTLRRERDRHVATLLAMTNWVRVRGGRGLTELAVQRFQGPALRNRGKRRLGEISELGGHSLSGVGRNSWPAGTVEHVFDGRANTQAYRVAAWPWRVWDLLSNREAWSEGFRRRRGCPSPPARSRGAPLDQDNGDIYSIGLGGKSAAARTATKP